MASAKTDYLGFDVRDKPISIDEIEKMIEKLERCVPRKLLRISKLISLETCSCMELAKPVDIVRDALTNTKLCKKDSTASLN